MISKELLSEICQTNLMSLGKLEVVGSDICLYDCSMQPDIYMCWNIYELAHKCKEWAFEFRFDNKPTNNRYYRQRSGYEDKFNVEKQKREKLGYMTLTFGCLGHTKTFYADTEPEAIFKACQWILDKDSK